jgi:hypothetical protein
LISGYRSRYFLEELLYGQAAPNVVKMWVMRHFAGTLSLLLLAASFGAAQSFERQVEDAVAEFGAAAAAAHPAPRRDPGGTMTLSLLSYNIWGIPSDEEATHERYAKIGKLLSQRREAGKAPQLVVIQEAFHPRTGELIEQAGYPYYRYGAPGSSDSPLTSGLIILSEYPIERAATIDYRRCIGFDCWANKGALHVRLLVPGLPEPLELFNTHMNAGPDEPGPGRDEAIEVRKDQIGQLLNFLRQARATS